MVCATLLARRDVLFDRSQAARVACDETVAALADGSDFRHGAYEAAARAAGEAWGAYRAVDARVYELLDLGVAVFALADACGRDSTGRPAAAGWPA